MSTTSAVFSEAATGTVMSAPTEAVSSPRDARREQLINSRQRVLESFRQERIVNLGANLSNRMDAAVERFFTIITRLESRILKLDATGISAEAATSELRAAATLLSETRALLTDIDAKVFAAATSPSPFSAWQDVRDQYLKIATNIRSVQSTLRNVIALLKEAVVVGVSAPLLPGTGTETATPTPATTL